MVFKKGQKPWNVGLKLPSHPNYNIELKGCFEKGHKRGMTDKHHSIQTKQNIGLGNRGHPFYGGTSGWFKKGLVPWNKNTKGLSIAWNKNIPCREKTKQKLSINIKKLYAEGKIKSYWKGKQITNEAKHKMSMAKWRGGSNTSWTRIARKTLEKKYGIPWANMYKPENAVIHHINHDRSDYKFENLCVMSNHEHTKFHNLEVI